ncbi:MAG: hypothetical protein AAB334_01560 [Patescibacteria group bacterium]
MKTCKKCEKRIFIEGLLNQDFLNLCNECYEKEIKKKDEHNKINIEKNSYLRNQNQKMTSNGFSIWTFLIFFGVAMLITALGYLFNPYYNSNDSPASWSSGPYSD